MSSRRTTTLDTDRNAQRKNALSSRDRDAIDRVAFLNTHSIARARARRRSIDRSRARSAIAIGEWVRHARVRAPYSIAIARECV